jgi:hypothetical protein
MPTGRTFPMTSSGNESSSWPALAGWRVIWTRNLDCKAKVDKIAFVRYNEWQNKDEFAQKMKSHIVHFVECLKSYISKCLDDGG